MPADLRTSSSDSRQPAPESSVAASLATTSWCARRGWPVHPPGRRPQDPGRQLHPVPHDSAPARRVPVPARRTLVPRIPRRHPRPAPYHPVVGRPPGVRRRRRLRPGRPGCHRHRRPPHPAAHPGPDPARYPDRRRHRSHRPGQRLPRPCRPGCSARPAQSRGRRHHAARPYPSGGLHVWYRAADNRRWRCSAGSSQGTALAWQVDVRAHGGYIKLMHQMYVT